MGGRTRPLLEAHKTGFFVPDIPGHQQRQDNLSGRRMNKRLIEHLEERTSALREELISPDPRMVVAESS